MAVLTPQAHAGALKGLEARRLWSRLRPVWPMGPWGPWRPRGPRGSRSREVPGGSEDRFLGFLLVTGH